METFITARHGIALRTGTVQPLPQRFGKALAVVAFVVLAVGSCVPTHAKAQQDPPLSPQKEAERRAFYSVLGDTYACAYRAAIAMARVSGGNQEHIEVFATQSCAGKMLAFLQQPGPNFTRDEALTLTSSVIVRGINDAKDGMRR